MSAEDSLTRKYHRQDVVYWERTGTDAFGDPTYDDPVQIKARWTDTMEEFVDDEGVRLVSKAVVLVQDDMAPSDVLMLGVLADVDSSVPPTENEKAFEIRRFTKTPNTKATKFLRRAWL